MSGFKEKLSAAIVAVATVALGFATAGSLIVAEANAQARQPTENRQPNVAQAPARPAAQPAAQPAPARPPAPVPQPVPERFEQWSVICVANVQGQENCRAEHVVRGGNRNAPQMVFRINPPAANQQLSVATIIPPWGILLAQGVVMQVDSGQALRAPVRTCIPQGCLADFTLVETLQTSLQKGTKAKITVVGTDGKPVAVDIPLAGYPQAYARLLAKAKK